MKLTEKDISLLAKKVPVEAFIHLGCFTSDLASSLTTIPHKGQITHVNDNGYIKWNIKGVDMGTIYIDCVELL